MTKIRHLAVAILIAIVAASCSQESDEERLELYRLATSAETFFKADDASAGLVDNRLVLSLVASNAGRLPYSERQYAAHEVALWTKRSYRFSDKLSSITVIFVETHWFPFYWKTSQSYTFAVKGLEQIPMPPEPATAPQ